MESGRVAPGIAPWRSHRSGRARLRHPVRLVLVSLFRFAIRGLSVDPVSRYEAPVGCPPTNPGRTSPFPPQGPRGTGSPVSSVLWRCATSCVPHAALRCLRLALPGVALVVSLPSVRNANRGPGVRHPVPTAGLNRLETNRTSQVPGEPSCPYAVFFDPGKTKRTRP